jgi:uncharacterized protein with HEPN domain
MSPSHNELLAHILDEAGFLLADSAAINEARFMGDGCRQRAYARSLEIIGEASKQISDDLAVCFWPLSVKMGKWKKVL